MRSIFKLLFPSDFNEIERLRNLAKSMDEALSNLRKQSARLHEINDELQTRQIEMRQKFDRVNQIQEARENQLKAQIEDKYSELKNLSALLYEANKKLEEKSKAYDELMRNVETFKTEFVKVQNERDELKAIRDKQLQSKRMWALKNKKANGKK